MADMFDFLETAGRQIREASYRLAPSHLDDWIPIIVTEDDEGNEPPTEAWTRRVVIDHDVLPVSSNTLANALRPKSGD